MNAQMLESLKGVNSVMSAVNGEMNPQQMAQIMKDEVPLLLRMNSIAFGIYQKNVQNMKRHMLIDKPYKFLDKQGDPVL